MEIKNKRVKKSEATYTNTEFAIFYKNDEVEKLIILGYGEEKKETIIRLNKKELEKLIKLINQKNNKQ